MTFNNNKYKKRENGYMHKIEMVQKHPIFK